MTWNEILFFFLPCYVNVPLCCFYSLIMETSWWEWMRSSVVSSGCCQIAQLWAAGHASEVWICYFSELRLSLIERKSLVFRSPSFFPSERCVPGSTAHYDRVSLGNMHPLILQGNSIILKKPLWLISRDMFFYCSAVVSFHRMEFIWPGYCL